jgi:hypothetical protein
LPPARWSPGALSDAPMSAELAIYVFIAVMLVLDGFVLWMLRG